MGIGLHHLSFRHMEQVSRIVTRRTFRWPGAARELVRAYLNSPESSDSGPSGHRALKVLITRMAAVSGNPRGACWRFIRHLGVRSKRSYRPWTKPEQQKLLDLISAHSLEETTVLMRRSSTSVSSMLHRLGASARMGQDWFTKHALAEALHVRAEEVQRWIDRGWLKARTIGTNGLKLQLIDANDFCEFCKQHRREIVGNRLNVDRLNFVQTYVFPPSHAELLPVRSAKKEQASYDEQMRKEAEWGLDEDEFEATA
ncbi:MAG TPA: hypothetical protein VEW05_01845 [Candidatus Polarisedimenticolia bacterium]|nr:hypothetical protein [Candidatus Polarisedimenticolia bacterium]